MDGNTESQRQPKTKQYGVEETATPGGRDIQWVIKHRTKEVVKLQISINGGWNSYQEVDDSLIRSAIADHAGVKIEQVFSSRSIDREVLRGVRRRAAPRWYTVRFHAPTWRDFVVKDKETDISSVVEQVSEICDSDTYLAIGGNRQIRSGREIKSRILTLIRDNHWKIVDSSSLPEIINTAYTGEPKYHAKPMRYQLLDARGVADAIYRIDSDASYMQHQSSDGNCWSDELPISGKDAATVIRKLLSSQEYSGKVDESEAIILESNHSTSELRLRFAPVSS